MTEHPPDEFDRLAGEKGPVGVHRAKPGWAPRIIIPIVLFVLAGAAAYGVVTWLYQQSGGKGLPHGGVVSEPAVTETVITGPDDVSPSPSATPSPSPIVTPSPTPTEEPVNLGASVAVLNGAGVSGLAGRNQQKLEDTGFTAVSAGNLTSNKPASNTVRYGAANLKTTAERVAEVLGIANVELGTTSGVDIDVLLVTDPEK